ncbi:hypothetical protein GA029_26230, partial [Bacteroides thetaiotaomicron]
MERLQVQIPLALQKRMDADGISNLTCEELAQRQIESINASPGSLTGIDCPECMNRGYFARLDSLHS